MRPRYVHRISPADVGQRVSVRRWIDDTEGRRPSDVVGRLIGWSDDDVLTIVTRRGDVADVAAADILASRTVPEHPTLPPEPRGPGQPPEG